MALVVVGGVAAGLSAAARARRIDPRLEIVVLEKGPVISYGACGVPYCVEGGVREARQLMGYTPEYFRRERNIEVRTGARVTSISHSRREVTLESGARLRYEHLVIATGARCDTSGFAGAEQPHVFTLQTLDDAERMRRFLREKRPKSAVVIGAGYIGLEAADALRRNGLQVTVLERSTHALGRDDPAFTAAVRRQLEAHCVELRCGVEAHEIGPDRVADIPCDMVVIAAGFKPNVELASQAGVETGRTGAIRTDDRMQTNLNGVFAGTGLSAAQARAEGFSPVSARIEAYSRPGYYDPRRTTVDLIADRPTGRLLGGSVIGEDGAAGRINVIAAALHAHLRVEDFEQLDLAYS